MRSPALIVLITNNTLAEPAGTERYVMTVARYLLENGHYPVVYSTRHGTVAEEIRSLGVPVLDNLDNLSVEPDIIHGHHHLDTACAIFRFPETPIIAFSHGVVPWEEAIFPPISRIHAYVTVSQARLKRVHTEGVPSDRTVHLPNFVDTDEFSVNFTNRRPRRSGSAKALVYGNASHKGLAAIEIACRRHGLKLDRSGHAFGQTACQPSRLLPGYELIFASGKAAMEALYCGAEVILSGSHGIGPHITASNFSDLYNRNFGLGVSCLLPTQSRVDRAVQSAYRRIQAGDRSVTAAQLHSLSHRFVLPRLLSLYRDAVSQWEQRRPCGQAQIKEEYAALSRYLHFLKISRTRDLERFSRLKQAEQELGQLRREIDRLRQHPFTFLCSRLARQWFQCLSSLKRRDPLRPPAPAPSPCPPPPHRPPVGCDSGSAGWR
ncbi:MAG: glycosyltransferase [Synechococcaceae cyanobacterium]|nr:glycosyltransferase [Synechococcaceae cyanobacterium]